MKLWLKAFWKCLLGLLKTIAFVLLFFGIFYLVMTHDTALKIFLILASIIIVCIVFSWFVNAEYESLLNKEREINRKDNFLKKSCQKCEREFILGSETTFGFEFENKDIKCPYCGSHKTMNVFELCKDSIPQALDSLLINLKEEENK